MAGPWPEYTAPAMASETRLDLGRYHLAALAQSEGTKALASAFKPAQDELQTAATARVEAEKAMTVRSVAVRFSENALERAIGRWRCSPTSRRGRSSSRRSLDRTLSPERSRRAGGPGCPEERWYPSRTLPSMLA